MLLGARRSLSHVVRWSIGNVVSATSTSLRDRLHVAVGCISTHRVLGSHRGAGGLLEQFLAVVAQIEPGARRWIRSVTHRTFPKYAVVGGGGVQVFLDEGESLSLLRPPAGNVKRPWNRAGSRAR